MFKSEKGITMITLVITIIITMILAAVSISYTMGEGSFIKRAQEATNESRVAGVQDLFQYYVSIDYVEDVDVFEKLLTNGYVKRLNNESGASVYYITHSGISNIASNYENTTTDTYIYQIVSELATADEATITQAQYDMLKDADVYLVDAALNIAYLSNGTQYGVVYFSKVVKDTTDKWWVAGSSSSEEEETKTPVVDWNKTATPQSYFKLDTSDINNQGTIVGFKISGAEIASGYTGGDLVIPSEIIVESASGQKLSVPVTKIADDAFSKDQSGGTIDITGNVYIPSSVTEIGANAFKGQQNMTGVHIAAENIGSNAFENCMNLTTIEFASTVKNIGAYAFAYAQNNVSSISFKEGLETIGNYAFYYCRKLGDIYLPSTLTSLGQGSFYGCDNTSKSIDLSKCTKLKTIPVECFYSCNSIREIKFAEGLETISARAFGSCLNCSIQDLTFPNSLKKIEDTAFTGTYNINGTIYISSSTTYTAANVFNSDYVSRIQSK